MQCSEFQDLKEAAADMIVCVASSANWLSYVTPAILIFSVGVAIIGVLTARATARKKATLDLIEKVESSEHYRNLHAVFSKHRREGTFSNLNDPKDEKGKADRKDVQDYLNHYELVSVGIQSGILDLIYYRDWMLGPFIRDWNAASDYIQRERWKWNPESEKWHYRKQIYEHYQKAARIMSHAAIDLVEDNAPPSQPQGPGDESLENNT